MSVKLLLPLVLVTAGLAFFAGRSTTKEHSSANQSEPSKTQRALQSSSSVTNPQPAPRSLADVRNLFSGTRSEGFTQLLEEARNSPDTLYGTSISHVLLAEWSEQDPEAAREYILANVTDRHELDHLLSITFRSEANEIGNSLAWIKNNVTQQDRIDSLTAAAYAGLATRDPKGALEHLNAHTSGYGQTMAMEMVVGEWAAADIQGVFDWIRTQPPSDNLYNNYSLVMYSYIEQDPGEAGLIIEDMSSGTLKTNLSEHYAQTLAEEDPAAAMSWASQLKDPEARQRALMQSVSVLGMNDPDEAVDYVNSQSDPEFKDQLAMHLSDHLSRTKPELLADRISGFPQGMQNNIATHLVQSWAMSDTVAAQDWIRQLPDGEMRNQTSLASAEMLAHRSPPQAFEFAVLNSDPNTRAGLITNVAEQWFAVDPESAQQAIESNPNLSDELKNEVLGALQDIPIADIVVP